VSDPTDPSNAAGDFRGSREEKRQDETVMINADNLSELVASAKGGPQVEPAQDSPKPEALANEDGLADSQLGRILVIAGIIVVLLAAIIIVYVNVIQK